MHFGSTEASHTRGTQGPRKLATRQRSRVPAWSPSRAKSQYAFPAAAANKRTDANDYLQVAILCTYKCEELE